MKIGVISDTHLRIPDKSLDYIFEELFKDTDMIIHAGDIVAHRVLNHLEERGVVAVCGNMDDFEVADSVPQTRIISAQGKSIGLIHGWGAMEGLENRILEKFADKKLDLIVYGHSHVPFWGKVRDVYLFNPGSARQNRYSDTPTVGLVEIADNIINASILPVKRSA
jgi:putative phosphoesterase